MRIVLALSNPVSVFQPSSAQIAELAQRLAPHALIAVNSEAELVAALPAADAAVVWRFDSDWYRLSERLRHVFTPAAGRERVMLDPSRRVTCHFGQFHGPLMAESLLGMMLFLNRRFGVALERQTSRDFDTSPYLSQRRLAGQTALIVGYGAIGQHAARLLSSVGMKVFGLKRDTSRGGEGVARLFAANELHTALALADHVICILPADTGTDRLLDRAAFQAMKDGAFVYNLGRGNAIDTEALAEALVSTKLGGAFLDVVPTEPLPRDSPLWTTPNLYLTPHASAIYVEYLDLYFAELAGLIAEISAANEPRAS